MKPSAIPRQTLRRDLELAQISDLAYLRDQHHVRLRLGDMGWPEVRFFNDAATGTNALLCWNDTEAVFAVRGTEREFADILTDLRFRFADTASGRVHAGFLAAWKSIEKDVAPVINYLRARGIGTTATGHSLGGAVAQLAAASLSIGVVVTFGAPRLGGARYAGYLKRIHAHRRYVRAADIVPLVPLLGMGFRHDCRPVYIDSSGRAHNDAPLWRELAGRARALFSFDWIDGGRFGCPAPRRMFTDHRIDGYMQDLARLAEGEVA